MSNLLDGKTITLGVSGGISAYRALDIARALTLDGAKVPVIMTAAAQKFATPLAFRTITGIPVSTDQFAADLPNAMQHLSASWSSDVIVIAPATANVIAKLANGIADDLLSTTALAAKSSIIVVPAMNERMYLHPATQNNLRILVERGVRIVGPSQGMLASGHSGWGRLSPVDEILEAIHSEVLRVKNLEGRRVIVTAGPTREPIDAVRYLANRSSGKMGYSLAEEALRRGAEVTLISGPVSIPVPPGATLVPVERAAEMEEAVLGRLGNCDILIMSAAVADLRPASPLNVKTKKHEALTRLELEHTKDILAQVGEIKRPGQIIVGFAAETNDLAAESRRKLAQKKLDMVVGNDVSRTDIGFASDYNEVILIYADGNEESLQKMSKRQLSTELWDRISRLA